MILHMISIIPTNYRSCAILFEIALFLFSDTRDIRINYFDNQYENRSKKSFFCIRKHTHYTARRQGTSKIGIVL